MRLGTSDVLRKAGIDLNEVMLMKHERNQAEKYRLLQMLDDYTRVQEDRPVSRNRPYWMVFTAENDNRARFYALYHNNGRHLLQPGMLPDGYPSEGARYGQDYQYDLEPVDVLREYEGRLVINWGIDRQTQEYADRNDKEIIAIEEQKPLFPGFDELICSFDELYEIISDPERYSAYFVAMSQVYAVYLVVDTVSGKQYVGSAYGDNGLWGRWSEYANTKGRGGDEQGGNKLMCELMSEYPDRYRHLRYSVLRILDKTTTKEDVIKLESLYKTKLCSKEFGLNAN